MDQNYRLFNARRINNWTTVAVVLASLEFSTTTFYNIQNSQVDLVSLAHTDF